MMQDVLAPACRPLLQRFREPRTLMAFDYDGTLAPIVARPSDAHMRVETRELLRRIAYRHPTVVISGRSRRDAQGFLQGVPLLEIIGNHGFESFGALPRSSTRQVAAWRDALKPQLAHVAGVLIEDKRLSLAIHYRASPDPELAHRSITEAARSLEGARFVGGNYVLNVLPVDAPHKGDALLRLCGRLGCDRAIYVGDDDTDEDVFALRQPERLLTILVGTDRQSAADYCVSDQKQIDDLLAILAA